MLRETNVAANRRKKDEIMAQNPPKKSFAIRANIFVLRLARNWLRIALTVLAIYFILPIAAPVMMRAGMEGPARSIYLFYSPFCHQMVFRSFFLFGEQAVYPRADVPVTGSIAPFESVMGDLDAFDGVDMRGYDLELITAARAFPGNDELGYKIALCQRDIFIYGALLLGGLVYSIPYVRRRLRPVPLWLYVLLGVGPIGIDGFSQLLSYPPFELWPLRETHPAFRVITGALFGFMTAWLGFPYLEESFRDTRRVVASKLARRGIHI
ncbi:MAG: DUF2085 domain-containing protein [Chloroflexota bacterium]